MEKAYDFRKRLLTVHEKDLRDWSRAAAETEYMLPQRVCICMDGSHGEVTETAVKDFVDYLHTSMGISSYVVEKKSVERAFVNPVIERIKANMDNAETAVQVETVHIRVALASEVGVDMKEAAGYKGFRIDTTTEGICVYGYDERGLAQGLYYIEMMMNMEHAPVMSLGTVQKKPMFYPRMIHSGYGLDEYPDAYLARVAHEGRDAILVFTSGANETPNGYLDFNDLISRAAKYGLDVYAYSYIVSNMSPEAPEAEAFYENTYGRLFEECPGLAGVTLVGESVEFPSKDPHVAKGRYFETAVDGIPCGKPSSGWYPCEDYPVWLRLLQKIIRRHSEKAEIVFWTYNWGKQPEEARIKLIENLPEGIILQATFEMDETIVYGNSKGMCADYTLRFEGPGEYFSSEAIAAKKKGIRLHSMTNTGGLTWDFGVIPYEPFPYQWIRRYKSMLEAHKEWGLQGLMESHHYGFTPSFISQLSNLCFLEPLEPMEDILAKILKAEFGVEHYEKVDKALKLWSEAIRYYTPSGTDQYGAFRVGPSFPFCLSRRINLPSDARAHFGNIIVEPVYNPGSHPLVSPLGLRIYEEKASLEKMRDLLEAGIRVLEETLSGGRLAELLNLGKFMRNSVITAIHAKEWHVLKCRLYSVTETRAFSETLDEMEVLLKKELANTEATIPLVEADSRLGWEPSMLYMTDRWHLEWKIRQIRYVLESDITDHRKSVMHQGDY